METTQAYESAIKLIRERRSTRRFRPDPIPDGYVEKILESARWAMSGANSQPWEFVVVRDAKIRDELYTAYTDIISEYMFWMEQQRYAELRHPSHQLAGTNQQQYDRKRFMQGWKNAPVLIVVLGDGRKQWGTVVGALTYGRGMTHLTDGLANACTNIHLAAAALGLGSQWVTIHIQEPFKRILGVPDLLTLHSIIPIGYPSADRGAGFRRELATMVHNDRYDMSKYLTNDKFIDYLKELRADTIPHYAQTHGKRRPAE